MEELFTNISDEEKRMAKFWVDMAFLEAIPLESIKMIEKYRDTITDAEGLEFFDFYVRYRMAERNKA